MHPELGQERLLPPDDLHLRRLGEAREELLDGHAVDGRVGERGFERRFATPGLVARNLRAGFRAQQERQLVLREARALTVG